MRKVFALTFLGFIFFWIVATVQASASENCLPPAQIDAIVNSMENAMARLTTQGNDEESEGTGFMLRSSTGTFMITAHHVVHDSPSPETCGGSDEGKPPASPYSLLQARATFQRSQPARVQHLQFSTIARNIDVENDLVRARMPAGMKFSTLRAESFERPPRLGEEVVIAGYPSAKKRQFVNHTCRFKGYTQAVYHETTPHYALDCDLDYDIAAMSGGVAINKCTGKVIGAVSAQEFEEECGNRGTPRFVQLAPVSMGPQGEILFGVQHTASSYCHYTDPVTTQPDVVRACNIGPRSYPRLDQTPALTGSSELSSGDGVR